MLFTDDRADEAIRAYNRGITLDPDGNLSSVRFNLGLLYYDEGRYDDAYDAWAEVPGKKEEMDQHWGEWTAVLRSGNLAAVPDSIRERMDPETLIHFGELDAAANRLAHPPRPNWIQFVYRTWSPIFDPIRDRPAMQAFLRDRGLEDVTIRRTPPGERKLPSVLRIVPTEATP